ncbi:beta-L-arabinofuranosidase domain-containing protein [Serratia sp. DD3]|uniref:beta-L-arabinofuranosidase domain-containing protein n=1 Tax=Serratia sp. DD3 TaxID=1410619 RepID=UPI0003C4FB61|nr:beta-L-arabinofuranosidase domain-containing protein [Serratia sp. DD3]KEY56441.1 hypothetical protein SRDD_44830 [Serratia sp. DD3]
MITTNAYSRIPLHQLQPLGWLRDQLAIQCNGMSGHLDQFWPDVQDSAWFGGDSEGWERAPYWLDGSIPLAWLNGDEGLIARITGYVDYILTHQQEDGWLGPKNANTVNPEAKEGYDIWAQFLAVKMLIEYHAFTEDARVEAAVERALRKIEGAINWTPLFDWGQARWFESFIAIFWLYERKPAPWLLDLCVKLEAQGFNWQRFIAAWPCTEATPKGAWNFMSHVVNNAMAVKAYALVWKLTGEARDRQTPYDFINQLDRHHGTAVGTFTGDECLAGKSPLRGTELCAAVEYMYSLEQLITIYGDLSFADRLEKIAFNALPGYFTRDMWAHQYNQQVNQVACVVDPDMPWNTNDPDANTYGLMPHFGCCTSNYHQGLPKFATHAWLQSAEELVAVSYIPLEFTTQLKGQAVKVINNSHYPFANRVCITLECDNDADFAVRLRIPSWSERTVIRLDGAVFSSGARQEVVIQRNWQGCHQIDIEFDFQLQQESREQGALALSYGPLVYALPLEEEWQRINSDKPYREFPHCDYSVTPTSAWNWAIDPSSVEVILAIPGAIPFSRENPPSTMRIKGIQLPNWQSAVPCLASAPPQSPLSVQGEETELIMIPFGCTHLRMGELPWYQKL